MEEITRPAKLAFYVSSVLSMVIADILNAGILHIDDAHIEIVSFVWQNNLDE